MSGTGIFWIRDDFRIENNPALSFATQNHENVIALFIYNNKNFDSEFDTAVIENDIATKTYFDNQFPLKFNNLVHKL